jgi:hypothetical protein
LWVDAFCELAVERGAVPGRVQVETQIPKPRVPARAIQPFVPIAGANETDEQLHALGPLGEEHVLATSSATPRQARAKNQFERVKILSRGAAGDRPRNNAVDPLTGIPGSPVAGLLSITSSILSRCGSQPKREGPFAEASAHERYVMA